MAATCEEWRDLAVGHFNDGVALAAEEKWFDAQHSFGMAAQCGQMASELANEKFDSLTRAFCAELVVLTVTALARAGMYEQCIGKCDAVIPGLSDESLCFEFQIASWLCKSIRDIVISRN